MDILVQAIRDHRINISGCRLIRPIPLPDFAAGLPNHYPEVPAMSAPVYVASIHDKGPGYLAFDLRDVLAALKNFIAQYSWRITGEFEVTPENVFHEIEPLVDGAEFTLQELERLSERITQTIDGTFVGYPLSAAKSEDAEDDVINFPNSSAQLVIRAVDSAFFEIYAKDERIVERLRRHFSDVRTQTPEHYFV